MTRRTQQASQKPAATRTSTPAATDWLPRAEIVAIIAERVRSPQDSIRQARDKVAKRIAYALKNGELSMCSSALEEWGRMLSKDGISGELAKSIACALGISQDVDPKKLQGSIEAARRRMNSGERLQFGRVVAWARDKWPGKLDDLPIRVDTVVRAETARIGITAPRALAYNLSEAPRLLTDCWEENQQLKVENQQQRAEIDRLRESAKKWKALRDKNRRSAHRGRK